MEALWGFCFQWIFCSTEYRIIWILALLGRIFRIIGIAQFLTSCVHDLVCSVAGSAGDALGDDSVAYGIEQFAQSFLCWPAQMVALPADNWQYSSACKRWFDGS